MPEHTVSRRRFLEVAGLGTAAALGACAISNTTANILPTLSPSPILTTPFLAGKVILGESAGTTAMPQPVQPGQLPHVHLPERVLAAVYYPYANGEDATQPAPSPNPLRVAKGPFPVLLYAHAYRGGAFGDAGSHSASRDFTSVEAMLRSVAAWGCVCVAPDLSWIQQDFLLDINGRALVLGNYYTYLADVLNGTLFAKQLDFSRMILVGHSKGAAGATNTGRIISGFGHQFKSLSYCLIAPESGGESDADLHNLLVLGGERDTEQGAAPEFAFTAGGGPKTLVMIPGANHFGYTDICPPDNSCGRELFDRNGTISRADQQQVGAEYLTALVRYYALGETNLVAYLNGSVIPDSLKSLNLQVQAKGFIMPPLPLDTHTPVVKL
jgi:hypothetical protein